MPHHAQVQGIGKDTPGEESERNCKGGNKYGIAVVKYWICVPVTHEMFTCGKQGKSHWLRSDCGDLWVPGRETWNYYTEDNLRT